ncbi:hypothetical protein [Shewanella algae]|uniref:hypothetical protein n=1 Tax=Shewanella algae TaxID=38313 RepID=UPI000D1BD583|nr:hypothetical protein [Shewanella algae]PSS73033.1 hypothetical protein AYI88_10375 [Shewanella algae]
MKTPQQINQMRPMPDSLVEAAVATLTTGTHLPQIVPLKILDGAKSLAEIVIEKTGGETEADVYLFVVPKDGGATFPVPEQMKEGNRVALYERLYRAGYGTEQIGKMHGLGAPAVSMFMARAGRPFRAIKAEMKVEQDQLLLS